MCGRFVQHQAPLYYIAHFGLDTTDGVPNAPPRFNAAPTQDLMVIRRHPQTRRLVLSLLKWGLVPVWSKDTKAAASLINARSETVTSKASFRDAWVKRRRCIVPADGFYEWRKDKTSRQPFYVSRRDGTPLAMAGLWEGWKDPLSGAWMRTFTILTCAANEMLAPLHPRMPVILEEAGIAAFLDAPDPAPQMQALPAAAMQMWPVSPAVNAVRNDTPDLTAPVAAEVVPPGP